MNEPIIVSESTLPDRYQTTVPEPIRKALHLHKREKIRYTIQPNGNVLLSRAEERDVDPVLNQFCNYSPGYLIYGEKLVPFPFSFAS